LIDEERRDIFHISTVHDEGPIVDEDSGLELLFDSGKKNRAKTKKELKRNEQESAPSNTSFGDLKGKYAFSANSYLANQNQTTKIKRKVLDSSEEFPKNSMEETFGKERRLKLDLSKGADVISKSKVVD